MPFSIPQPNQGSGVQPSPAMLLNSGLIQAFQSYLAQLSTLSPSNLQFPSMNANPEVSIPSSPSPSNNIPMSHVLNTPSNLSTPRRSARIVSQVPKKDFKGKEKPFDAVNSGSPRKRSRKQVDSGSSHSNSDISSPAPVQAPSIPENQSSVITIDLADSPLSEEDHHISDNDHYVAVAHEDDCKSENTMKSSSPPATE
jgi:hypothetical protein